MVIINKISNLFLIFKNNFFFSILLNLEGKAKLTDFGLSKIKTETETNTGAKGTMNWMVFYFFKSLKFFNKIF